MEERQNTSNPSRALLEEQTTTLRPKRPRSKTQEEQIDLHDDDNRQNRQPNDDGNEQNNELQRKAEFTSSVARCDIVRNILDPSRLPKAPRATPKINPYPYTSYSPNPNPKVEDLNG